MLTSFETAVKHHICAVGIITIENSKIIEEFYSLIKPPNNEYSYYCTQVHEITFYDIVDSPSFAEITPAMSLILSTDLHKLTLMI